MYLNYSDPHDLRSTEFYRCCKSSSCSPFGPIKNAFRMPGFDLEIIEPHDGTDVTAQGGLFPHIAIEVNDIDAAIADLKAAGITNFRRRI